MTESKSTDDGSIRQLVLMMRHLAQQMTGEGDSVSEADIVIFRREVDRFEARADEVLYEARGLVTQWVMAEFRAVHGVHPKDWDPSVHAAARRRLLELGESYSTLETADALAVEDCN